MIVRKRPTKLAGVLVTGGAALALVACGGPTPAGQGRSPATGVSAPAATAVLTGTAWPCAGIITRAAASRVRVRVVLVRRSRVVATETVPGGTAYRFTAAPGRYLVSSNAQYQHPQPVTLRAGAVERVALSPPCK